MKWNEVTLNQTVRQLNNHEGAHQLFLICFFLWNYFLTWIILRVTDHSLPVPPHLQELYDMYMKELDDRKLEKAIGLEKVTIRQTIKVTTADT